MTAPDCAPLLAALDARLRTATGTDRFVGQLIRDGLSDLAALYNGPRMLAGDAEKVRGAIASQLRSAREWLAAVQFT